MHHGEVQITAQRAWGRASLSAGTKHCDQWGTGTHPQTPPVLSSQTSGGPQGPRLERLFTVSGSGVQERPTPTLRPMEPGAATSARTASEQPQGSEWPGPQRLPRTRLPSKQVCSQKPKPSTRHPAGSPRGVCGEGTGAEGTPGAEPALLLGWGEHPGCSAGSVSWPHLPLPCVEGEQQRPKTRVRRRQAGWPRLRSQSASRPLLQPPTPNSALTPKAPPSSPETALLNPLASIPEASKHGLSWPIPGALSVFTAPTASLLRAHNKNQKPLLAAPGRHTERGPGEQLGRHCSCKDVPQSYGRTPETGPGVTWYWAHRSPPGEKSQAGGGPWRCPAPHAGLSLPNTGPSLLLCCTSPNVPDAPKRCCTRGSQVPHHHLARPVPRIPGKLSKVVFLRRWAVLLRGGPASACPVPRAGDKASRPSGHCES